MNRIALCLVVVCGGMAVANAQPMNGNYTIGGATPDFATPQDAASALFAQGVSGPVFLNIRPGIYMRNGGNSTVLRLDTVIAGVTATNRITFQPDAGAGGNADNVILQFDRTGVGDANLVHIQNDFITLRNLTLRDIDSSQTFDSHLIRVQQIPGNTFVDGFVLEGCRLIGSPYLDTDFGVGIGLDVRETTIRGNTFLRLRRAISSSNRGTSQATITVEDNHFTEGWIGFSGAGNTLGASIELDCSHAVVRRNVMDYSGRGGFYGISVVNVVNALIERNTVIGPLFKGIFVRDNGQPAIDSVLIANNMITRCNFQWHGTTPTTSLHCEARNARIYFNTIILPPGPVWGEGLSVLRPNARVFNNIINLYGGLFAFAAFFQGSEASPTLVSDYNVIYADPNDGGGPLYIRNGRSYRSVAEYQDSTGQEMHSVAKPIDVLNVLSDLHLTDCGSQDPDLRGIPIPGIVDDIDGDVRSLIHPTRGADEVAQRSVPLWGAPVALPVGGTPFSLAAGNFDGQPGDDIAVTDYTNDRVLLFRNNPASRSFTPIGSLTVPFHPYVVKLFDLDEDGHLDLLVGGEAAAVQIFWGNGTGGFPSQQIVNTLGRVVSIEPEPFRQYLDFNNVFLTEDNGFLPNSSWLGYIRHEGNRQVCHDVMRKSGVPFWVPDTLETVMNDFVVTNLAGESRYDAVALGLGGPHGLTPLVIFPDLQSLGSGGPCGSFFESVHTYHSFGTASYLGNMANIVAADFDGDGDRDLITTGASITRCMLLRNQGNFNFVPDTIPVNYAQGLVVLDYNNDGRLDFVTINRFLHDNGLTLFVNDGTGRFRPEFNCYPGFARGAPYGVVASDFDLDGRTDLALASAADSVFVIYNFGGGISHVDDGRFTQIPGEFRLEQNYPNPFNPKTTIRFHSGSQQLIELKVYDILGREVATLVNEIKSPGSYEVVWDASGRASGVYFYRIQAGGFVETKKLLLIR